jgi:hypothetical protein
MTQAPTHLSIFDVRERLEDSFKRIESLLHRAEQSDDIRAQVLAAAELRKHIALAARTLESVARLEAIQALKQDIIDAFSGADQQTRQRILSALESRLSTL